MTEWAYADREVGALTNVIFSSVPMTVFSICRYHCALIFLDMRYLQAEVNDSEQLISTSLSFKQKLTDLSRGRTPDLHQAAPHDWRPASSWAPGAHSGSYASPDAGGQHLGGRRSKGGKVVGGGDKHSNWNWLLFWFSTEIICFRTVRR